MDQIRLSGIRKTYGHSVAIRNLDLVVNPGEFLTILGPSGCGKTTTLRAIAGLEEPDDGVIQIGDKVVFSRREGIIVPPEKRGLGLIFQSYALWPHMTVERNITLALKEQHLSPDEVERRLTNALEMVQMSELRNRYPSELSGGQQQRVAVARLIALRPSVLLMDEPLSNLDAKLRTEMRAGLKRLHRDLEATTVYVTHDQIEALTLSDRVIIMNEGDVMQEGSPYDIYHNPANLFVAEFIGDPKINLFEGTVDGAQVRCADLSLPLPENANAQPGKVVVSVRPESVLVSYAAKKGWLKASVENVQPTGAETILQIVVGDTQITLLQPGFITMEEGKPIWIRFDPATLNLFDPQSGANIGAPVTHSQKKAG